MDRFGSSLWPMVRGWSHIWLHPRLLAESEALDALRNEPSLGSDDSGLLLARAGRAELDSVLVIESVGVAGELALPPAESASGLAPEWTATVTVYSCLNDTTGAYACQSGVPAGACGYILNPGAEGPGVTGPSLYVAAGPSWPCGTVFELSTGQRVIVADRGGMVHDGHLDAYCFDAKNRAMCLPGIGASVGVRVVE
jgi:hypothetical protein